MRHLRTILWASVLGSALLATSAHPTSPPQDAAKDFDKDAKKAVDRGLAWLAKEQRANGSWTCKIGYKLYESYNGKDGEHVGITALACMAFVGAGHTPDRGKYGRNVARGLKYVLSCVRDEDGYITSNGTRMYTHAFATMFLAEIYGMSKREDVKTKLKRSVALLVAAQNKEGGWRYSPMPVDADLSVTVSCLQGLRAARNVGIGVPEVTIKKATRYVRRCYTQWGFRYQATDMYVMNDSRITFPLTACGIVSLYSAGDYRGPEVRKGVKVLNQKRRELFWGRYHYFYGHYYGAQAMYAAGGLNWSGYYRTVRREILSHQQSDGGWIDDVGRSYATAMACVVLQMPCELLPIFQK